MSVYKQYNASKLSNNQILDFSFYCGRWIRWDKDGISEGDLGLNKPHGIGNILYEKWWCATKTLFLRNTC